MNEKVSYERQKETVPNGIENVAWEIVCQKADSEERDKLFIHAQLPGHFFQAAIHIQHLGIAVEQLRVISEKPTESHDLFHVVNNKNNRQK